MGVYELLICGGVLALTAILITAAYLIGKQSKER